MALFQRLDLLRQGGLGDVQTARGTAETAIGSDAVKRAQVLVI